MSLKSYLICATISITTTFSAQSAVPYYSTITNQVKQNNITENLQQFQNIGVKTTGSVKLTEAFNWLKSKYTSYGYNDTQITEQSFNYQGTTSKNLIVTKTGTKYPNTFVIISGHYDTLNGPGTNDNGSGVSVILEMARLLQNIETEYSIKFINFAGEEQGLIGSKAYVKNVVNSTTPKMSIKLVFNIDEVGGVAGQINNEVMCERDENNTPSTNNAASQLVTQDLMSYVTYYSPLQPKLSNAYASDYMPFEANGEVITGFYEGRQSTQPHTANDTLDKMDPLYVFNITKAATGALLHFSAAKIINLASNEIINPMQSLSIVNMPNEDFIHLNFENMAKHDYEFSIFDTTGQKIISSKNRDRIDVSQLVKGLYFGTLTINQQSFTKKFIIN